VCGDAVAALVPDRDNSQDQSVTVIDTQSLTATTATVSGVPHGSALVPPQ